LSASNNNNKKLVFVLRFVSVADVKIESKSTSKIFCVIKNPPFQQKYQKPFKIMQIFILIYPMFFGKIISSDITILYMSDFGNV
jgi:hypothetical protein